MECSKVVPGMEPLTASHPPEVLTVWAKANHASASTPRAFLRVSGCHECFLMLNGRLLDGPAHQMGVTPGTYRVQVRRPEQPPGKALVHEVTLAPSTMTTVYIASFEPYVRESPVGFFVASESGRALGRPMETLARQLDVERVLLVRALDAGSFELYAAAAVGGA